jgi:predicted aldo/keto reductase-like oxidoreductase
MTFEFDPKKQEAAIKSIEALCYHCEKHVDNCPVNVAVTELKQEYNEKNKRPEVNYRDFEFDAAKIKAAISTVEEMCWHCKEHSDECPIARAVTALQPYVK